ncbi:YceI family protein [Wenzhouxiangella sp. XN79A]|uniref:YceI family protein n=1 Tax=Wenzhouxiangella sp. XN79A TaxID=2724193 RepID=UPI00144AE376|nr:YceI family protein [Wenzhouxiangella sp. XN79A]NKI33973.1 YceI family protein [Wenzhouxiangella sp. XN79A]
MNLRRLATPLAPLVAALALAPCWSARAEPIEWAIDPDHFSIGFEVMHIGYARTLGLFLDAEGRFVYDPETGTLSSGRVVVQADSVFTDHDRRDRHVRSDDFLSADDHPEIVFEATDYEPGANGQGTLSGNLTLRGQSHPVELETTINRRADYPFGHGKDTLGISATTTLRRSEWGMTYALDNDLVGDEVVLRFEFEALNDGVADDGGR